MSYASLSLHMRAHVAWIITKCLQKSSIAWTETTTKVPMCALCRLFSFLLTVVWRAFVVSRYIDCCVNVNISSHRLVDRPSRHVLSDHFDETHLRQLAMFVICFVGWTIEIYFHFSQNIPIFFLLCWRYQHLRCRLVIPKTEKNKNQFQVQAVCHLICCDRIIIFVLQMQTIWPLRTMYKCTFQKYMCTYAHFIIVVDDTDNRQSSCMNAFGDGFCVQIQD